ncbi:MAG: hypothetical protein JWL81_2606, partial [Verrucomicrobiales bacterium]|nr:hypothetical protein [Verrucomicrobiales bacterium]
CHFIGSLGLYWLCFTPDTKITQGTGVKCRVIIARSPACHSHQVKASPSTTRKLPTDPKNQRAANELGTGGNADIPPTPAQPTPAEKGFFPKDSLRATTSPTSPRQRHPGATICNVHPTGYAHRIGPIRFR